MSLVWDSHNNMDTLSNPMIAGQASTSERQGSSFTSIHILSITPHPSIWPPFLPPFHPSLAAVETESISMLLPFLQEPIDH